MGIFTAKFWKDMSDLSLYSKEDSPLLSDQYDAGSPGGGNPSDAEPDEKGSSDELDNDIGLDTDIGGEDDISMDENSTSEGEIDDSMNSDDTSGDSSTGANQMTDPNVNPFKNQNGKSMLDDKLAELQITVTDTLDRIYANPKIEQVVVSELENLADSIRNIRETVFVVPVDATLYKYQLSITAYKKIAEEICNSFNEE